MHTEFLGSDIWSAIRTEAKQYQGKSFVAVAYFGTGASKRLPLKKESILVVDATDRAVKSGQTNPSELKKLQDKGVLHHWDEKHEQNTYESSRCSGVIFQSVHPRLQSKLKLQIPISDSTKNVMVYFLSHL
jgi:4-hydroxy-3-methylbut-2-enyl diphosphate reductase IspH